MLEKITDTFFAEKERWFSWISVLFGMGIGLYFGLSAEPSLWWTLGIIEIFILIVILYRKSEEKLLFLSIPAIVLAGFTYIQLDAAYIAKIPRLEGEEAIYVQGRISNVDYNSKQRQRITLEKMQNFAGEEIKGSYKITLMPYAAEKTFQVGECVELAAKVMPPYPTTMVGGYQFDRKTFFDKINGTGYSLSRVFVIPCGKSQITGESVIEKIRNKIVKRIESVLPQDEAGIASALIAGVRNGISQRVTNNYRDSGLAHFLSISGLHMSMLAGFMFLLVRYVVVLMPSLALRYDSKKIAAVFAVVMSFVYLLISGYSVPTQRAFLMTLIFLIGVMISRRSISMRTISWAALCVLMVSPVALITPSFQMSFAAVIALIAFYEKFSGKLQHFLDTTSKQIFIIRALKIIVLYVVGILVSDLVASLATLPFSIYHFNQIALLTSLANLLAGPIIGLVIMPFTLLSLLLMPLGLDELSLKIVGFGIHWVNEITAWVSSMPNANMPVLSPPLWGLIAMVLGGLWLCLWQGKIRLLGMLGILGGIFSFCFIKVPDILINSQGDLIALKDNYGQIVIMPHRGDAFTKKIWLDKTASKTLSKKQYAKLRKIYKGQKQDKNWIDLECQKQECVYRNIFKFSKSGKFILNGKELSLREEDGNKAIFLPNQIYSVKDISGLRPWNKKIRN